MKTVFITGASTGIGRETAKLFQKNGWQVIATMRRPQQEKELNQLENTMVTYCDVTDKASIEEAVRQGVERFGGIDALVNNAGYYTVGVLEAATEEQIKRQLDTNLLGLIETTQAVIPYMRKGKGGTIINLSSIAGRMSIPLQTLYHATKYAIEGFSESLQYEMAPFNVRVKLIEPGTIKTDFTGRSMTVVAQEKLAAYQPYATQVFNNLVKNGNAGSSPEGVAKTIYKAATDGSKKMRYPTGKMKGMIKLRQLLPVGLYMSLVNQMMQN